MSNTNDSESLEINAHTNWIKRPSRKMDSNLVIMCNHVQKILCTIHDHVQKTDFI